MNNARNQYGVKDQADCYRSAGKFIQWIDEACTDPTIEEFDMVRLNIKLAGYKVKTVRIDDGRRLFVESTIIDDNKGEIR